MKNIVVFFGGESVEHDISIITALQAMKNIKGCALTPLYIKSDGTCVSADNLTDPKIYLDYKRKVKNEKVAQFSLASGEILLCKNGKIKNCIRPYCALLCNHGHNGEDGALQGMLEMCKIPYSSSSVASSAITMDKHLTKVMLTDAHILTPKYVHICKSEFETKKIECASEVFKKVGYPCVIKPATLGSSVGISICENENMLMQKLEEAFVYDNKIVIEEFIEQAREFACAVRCNGGKILSGNVDEVKKGRLFTFEEKYLFDKEGEKREIEKLLYDKIKLTAEKTYKIFECGGVVRVDFLYCEKTKKLYVGEVNSIPGSLSINLFPFPIQDQLENLIEEGRDKFFDKAEICYKFSSQAIERYIYSSIQTMKK